MHKNLQNVHKQGHLRNDKSDRSRLAKTFFTVHEGRVGLPFASFLVYENTENALVFYRKSYWKMVVSL